MAITSSNLRSLYYDIRKYYGFKGEELRGLAAGIIVLAIAISFNEWGIDQFNLFYGLRNLFNAILIILLSFLIHVSAQRVMALFSGFKVEYRPWMYGLALALILAIVSRGRLWFIVPGGVIVYHMAGHRLGSFRYGLNYWPLGLVGLAGPVASVFLAVFFKLLLYVSPTNPLLIKAMVFNIWYAVLTMLPIPPLDGSHMFFASRLSYVFVYGFIIGLCLSLYFLSITLSLVLGVVLAAVLWLLTYIFFEKGD
ncbi:hypothetical protein COV19_04465 [Candidatus Woesearchaeota archaeon CG10_big_fil_rev_8_21_14_0_10_44_13]|nr:MAG: hypothetical protein COV19_04465 [Candidatus Woesearchaeota archaeon CG10_big_fil_rev_8_21_14_0_10_44_13]